MGISTSAHRSGKREEIRFLHKAHTVTFVSFESFSFRFNKCVSGEGGRERPRKKKDTSKNLTDDYQRSAEELSSDIRSSFSVGGQEIESPETHARKGSSCLQTKLQRI